MNNTEINGFELTTLNGTRTYDVQNVQPNGSTITTTMSEPFFVKGICKTASVITYTDTAIGTPAPATTDPSFDVYYAKTANGFSLSVGQTIIWEMISYRSTPYGAGYKNETNWRSVPTDLFQTT